MKVFFTADTHFGHRKISAYCRRRLFLSPQELEFLDAGVPLRNRENPTGWCPSNQSVSKMDDYLIDKINDTVGEDDILWHLGDFCFGPFAHIREHAQRYRDRIKCKTVNLVFGNHDDRKIAPVFSSTYERYRLQWNGRKFILSHCAHAVWEGSHHGTISLYGHSHCTAEDNLDLFSIICQLQPKNIQDLYKKLSSIPDLSALKPCRRSIDIGVDNAFKVLGDYRPFSLNEIEAIMGAREGISIDCHKDEE